MFDSAKFVPKGSDIVFSMHYTAIGKAGDRPVQAGSGLCEAAAEDCATSCTDGPTAIESRDPGGRQECGGRFGNDGDWPIRNWSTCSRTCICAARTTKSA